MPSLIGFYEMSKCQGFEPLVREYLAYTKAQEDLDAAASALRSRFWALQAPLGVVNVGDFTFYDKAWDILHALGAKNEAQKACSGVKSYFQALQENANFAKTRWLDSEFFTLTPKFSDAPSYELNTKELFSQFAEAKSQGYRVKFTLFGLFSVLFFAKLPESEEKSTFKRFKSAYFELIEAIAELENGVEVDFNELAFSAAQDAKMTQTLRCTLGMPAVECIYDRFEAKGIHAFVNSFEYNADLLRILCSTRASGVGFDANQTPPNELLELLAKSGKAVKLGIIGLEKLNLDAKCEILGHYLKFIPKERLILSLSNRLCCTNFAYIKAHSDFGDYYDFAKAKVDELLRLDEEFKKL